MTLLSHDTAGDGPDVALFHSSVCDRRMWDPQWQTLIDAGFRVTRFDFQGFGETPVPTGPWNASEDVIALLDSLGIGRFHAVGASFGGRVAHQLAARWPDRVEKLLLLCSAAAVIDSTPDLDAFDEREEELVEQADIDALVALNVDTWLGPEASAEMREFVGAMQRRAFEVQFADEVDAPSTKPEFDLADITAETLVVQGAKDLEFFVKTARVLAGEIPGARLVELDWAGHLPTLENPAKTEPLILDFLKA
ncbi:alpha/beta fold hydrolase [Phytomonospora endophytica]|uniref:Pimeloyl-ACP methyl ester carboxylesterase n=1 Tax=Phytomonospora endophytica TaxID=714109 RepID=A0A841FMZ2_9ACTN|nr:alpha/beta fold hydrolase [Phytomonospora endophytica]MBB6036273.1 pimeloyl-ACP methyl ester carboxylesterase [Phytomonospora endophytica]